jgi:hypothetical protein
LWLWPAGKEFSKVVFGLKQKIITLNNKNGVVNQMLLKKIENKSRIEDKLYEIKSMEIDFSEILNQMKK